MCPVLSMESEGKFQLKFCHSFAASIGKLFTPDCMACKILATVDSRMLSQLVHARGIPTSKCTRQIRITLWTSSSPFIFDSFQTHNPWRHAIKMRICCLRFSVGVFLYIFIWAQYRGEVTKVTKALAIPFLSISCDQTRLVNLNNFDSNDCLIITVGNERPALPHTNTNQVHRQNIASLRRDRKRCRKLDADKELCIDVCRCVRQPLKLLRLWLI